MKVQNRKCVRHLSFKYLMASRKRNLIAVIAIVLTTLLFTSLFTIVLSINSSYETYQFRQLGGYCHGTFKDVTDEQAAAIAKHSKVKETGERRTIGVATKGVFAKVPAEVSYMDANCTKWSYAEPKAGRMPEADREIAMDTAALNLLGIKPELGAQVPLTYRVGDKDQTGFEQTDTFTLVGYWPYDELIPVHYVNISKEYAAEIEKKGVAAGMDAFRTDLNVMMASSIDIRGQMEQVDTDLGYTWETYEGENAVRIGVNWGYTTSQIGSTIDFEMVVAIVAFIILVVFTGYLIIYNIFQISVTGDIRFYGLLKTIGTTPRQLKRIIRHQALFLCVVGIPAGVLSGYGIGAVLMPVVMENTTFGSSVSTVSVSPWIFVGSVLFSLITVLLSCAKPGKLAAKVSPVEAVKYTDAVRTKKKSRATRGAKVHQMAFANLGRNKSKTILVVLSLALSVTLLNELYIFVNGFNMEKYVSRNLCADFIVSSTEYFRFDRTEEYISEEMIANINANTDISFAGCGYEHQGGALMLMKEEVLRNEYMHYGSESMVDARLAGMEQRDGMYLADFQREGLDESLFEKLGVVEGDLSPMFDEDVNAIAVSVRVDDYGNIINPEEYPEVGDTLTIFYTEDAYYIDSRTGEKSNEDTPEEYLKLHIEDGHDVRYTVCALVKVPHSMSHRYYVTGGYEVYLPVEKLRSDSGSPVVPLFYLFDTPDEAAEAGAEEYLAELTAGDFSPLMYESKATVRADFQSFQNLFLLLGGLLCAIIGLVGILNFFNAIMTGIISRRREFAVLQSVGMTGRQLKAMLVYEGIFYAFGSVAAAFILVLVISPFVGSALNNMFWYFEYQFLIAPVLATVPLFILLGWLIPTALYGQTAKQSVVERLRESMN